MGTAMPICSSRRREDGKGRPSAIVAIRASAGVTDFPEARTNQREAGGKPGGRASPGGEDGRLRYAQADNGAGKSSAPALVRLLVRPLRWTSDVGGWCARDRSRAHE